MHSAAPPDEPLTLNGFDEEGLEGHNELALASQKWVEENIPVWNVPYQATFWIVCATTSIYSSKHLMVNHSYHYPLAISFRSFVAMLGAYIIFLGFGFKSSSIGCRFFPRWTIQNPRWQDMRNLRGWALMTPAAAASAISMPLFMEGVLHMPSLVVLMMLSPLVHVTNLFILSLSATKSRSHTESSWKISLCTLLLGAVLYDEYRLMVPGLVLGVSGIICAGVSRAFFFLGTEKIKREHTESVQLSAYHGFIIMTLVFGVISSGILANLLENIPDNNIFFGSTSILLGINTCSSLGAAISGSSIIAFSPISFQAFPSSLELPLATASVLPSVASFFLVVLASLFLGPLPFISLPQIAAFLAVTSILFWSSRSKRAGSCPMSLDSVRNGSISRCERSSTASVHSWRSKNLVSITISLLLPLAMAWSVRFGVITAINAIPANIPPQLDHNYAPSSRFDIVVSMYHEDPASVKLMLSAIKGTAALRNVQARVIIYTKEPTANSHELKSATGADVVEKLENRGREGGTYLYHIVKNWDHLAEQTMFIQAHAHNMRELIPRINDYLVAKSGMLSLGFTGVLCNCESCNDRWGWEDKLGTIPSVYELVHNRTCAQSVLLSYKGQFVASARRIRGISPKIYKDLLDAITSKTRLNHDPELIGSNLDSPDAPYFGYSVERLWNVLLQCSDLGVATKCPSLLSGWRRGGQVDDCQCLD